MLLLFFEGPQGKSFKLWSWGFSLPMAWYLLEVLSLLRLLNLRGVFQRPNMGLAVEPGREGNKSYHACRPWICERFKNIKHWGGSSPPPHRKTSLESSHRVNVSWSSGGQDPGQKRSRQREERSWGQRPVRKLEWWLWKNIRSYKTFWWCGGFLEWGTPKTRLHKTKKIV